MDYSEFVVRKLEVSLKMCRHAAYRHGALGDSNRARLRMTYRARRSRDSCTAIDCGVSRAAIGSERPVRPPSAYRSRRQTRGRVWRDRRRFRPLPHRTKGATPPPDGPHRNNQTLHTNFTLLIHPYLSSRK